MHTETRTTDSEGRLVLPRAFANATVVVTRISATEVRIHLATPAAAETPAFAEEASVLLTDGDRDRFLELLANPPKPTPALTAAANRFKTRRHG